LKKLGLLPTQRLEESIPASIYFAMRRRQERQNGVCNRLPVSLAGLNFEIDQTPEDVNSAPALFTEPLNSIDINKARLEHDGNCLGTVLWALG
jgi:hypothetical protein